MIRFEHRFHNALQFRKTQNSEYPPFFRALTNQLLTVLSASLPLPRLFLVVIASVSIAFAQQVPEKRNSSVGQSGKRIALVIGNDAYQNVTKLEKAGNDAIAFSRVLRDAGFEVSLHRDLNYRSMVRVVETFSNSIAGGDQVVVFFAGHGVQIKTGNYLLPVDIDAASSLSDLAKILHRNRQVMRTMKFRTSVCTTEKASHSD